MSEKPVTVDTPQGVAFDAAKSDINVTGSGNTSDAGSHVPKSGLRSRAREGYTFDADGLEKEYYKPIDTYEGIHRYDPDFDWEPEEERKVVRKVRRGIPFLYLFSHGLSHDQPQDPNQDLTQDFSFLRASSKEYR